MERRARWPRAPIPYDRHNAAAFHLFGRPHFTLSIAGEGWGLYLYLFIGTWVPLTSMPAMPLTSMPANATARSKTCPTNGRFDGSC